MITIWGFDICLMQFQVSFSIKADLFIKLFDDLKPIFNNCHLASHSVNKVALIISKEIIHRASFHNWNCYFSARGRCLQKYSVSFVFPVFELHSYKKQKRKEKKKPTLFHITLPLNLLDWVVFFVFVGESFETMKSNCKKL